MNTPPLIPPAPPVLTQNPPKPSFARQAAACSIVAPFVGMGVNILSQPAVQGNRAGMMIVGCMAILFILTGFVLGIIALVQTRTQGKQGVFGKAIAGVCINGLLIALMLLSIPGLMKAAERAKHSQRQRLEQQQQQP